MPNERKKTEETSKVKFQQLLDEAVQEAQLNAAANAQSGAATAAANAQSGAATAAANAQSGAATAPTAANAADGGAPTDANAADGGAPNANANPAAPTPTPAPAPTATAATDEAETSFPENQPKLLDYLKENVTQYQAMQAEVQTAEDKLKELEKDPSGNADKLPAARTKIAEAREKEEAKKSELQSYSQSIKENKGLPEQFREKCKEVIDKAIPLGSASMTESLNPVDVKEQKDDVKAQSEQIKNLANKLKQLYQSVQNAATQFPHDDWISRLLGGIGAMNKTSGIYFGDAAKYQKEVDVLQAEMDKWLAAEARSQQIPQQLEQIHKLNPKLDDNMRDSKAKIKALESEKEKLELKGLEKGAKKEPSSELAKRNQRIAEIDKQLKQSKAQLAVFKPIYDKREALRMEEEELKAVRVNSKAAMQTKLGEIAATTQQNKIDNQHWSRKWIRGKANEVNNQSTPYAQLMRTPQNIYEGFKSAQEYFKKYFASKKKISSQEESEHPRNDQPRKAGP